MAVDAKAVARSIRYQRKQVGKHRCPKCGKKTNGAYYCRTHAKLDRERKAAA